MSGGMHSPHPIVAMLQRWAYRLRQLIPRQPILTESPMHFLMRLRYESELRECQRRWVTAEQLKHEYGFDDDR